MLSPLLRRPVWLVLLWLAGLSGCAPAARPPADAPRPSVLLISIDGFRADYLDRFDVPHLQELARRGVRAEALIPSFPSKTFPNHYTLVTGLYPDHHGIIANNMYDPAMDASFSLSNREAVSDGRWWGGEPLWVTAERQGQRSATYFWPGSEAAIRGVRPSYWLPYDDDVPGPARVDQVLAWLDLPPAERPAFITLYFSEVDHWGHEAGPDAPETRAAAARVDGYVGRLLDGLAARGLDAAVNVIVVSDHGMVATSPERAVVLDDYVRLDDLRIVDWSPVLMLYPPEDSLEAVYDALRRAPHLTVYRKEALPEALHFGTHPRVPPLVALADEGWVITTRAQLARSPERFAGGTHGYDPRVPSMHALFIAAGPAFRNGLTVEPFSNVHVYSLMAAILGLAPAPNDGDVRVVQPLLRSVVQTP